MSLVVLFSLGLVEDRVIELRVSSYKLHEDSRKYSWAWCLGLIPTLKVCVLAQIVVVPTGVTVLFELCNPPCRGVNSRSNLV
jgi:hypothetical protein